MRMIDEKGRLFGRVNVIDFAVLLFLACMLPGLYFGYKIFGSPPQEKDVIRKEWVLVKAEFENLMPEVAGAVKEGDIEEEYKRNTKGQLIVRAIARLNAIADKRGSKVLVLQPESNAWLTVTRPDTLDAVLLIEILCARKDDGLYFKDTKVKIGGDISFQPAKYDINGTIIAMGENER